MSREQYYQTLGSTVKNLDDAASFVGTRYSTSRFHKGHEKFEALVKLSEKTKVEYWRLVTDPGLFSSDSRFNDFVDFVNRYPDETNDPWAARRAFNDFTLSPTGKTTVYRGIWATEQEIARIKNQGLLPKASEGIKAAMASSEKDEVVKENIMKVGLKELHMKPVADMLQHRIQHQSRTGPPTEEFTQSVTFMPEMAAAVAGRVRDEEQLKTGVVNPDKKIYVLKLEIPTIDVIDPEEYVPNVVNLFEVVLGNRVIPDSRDTESVVLGNITPQEIVNVEEWKGPIEKVETRLRPKQPERDDELEELNKQLAALRQKNKSKPQNQVGK